DAPGGFRSYRPSRPATRVGTLPDSRATGTLLRVRLGARAQHDQTRRNSRIGRRAGLPAPGAGDVSLQRGPWLSQFLAARSSGGARLSVGGVLLLLVGIHLDPCLWAKAGQASHPRRLWPVPESAPDPAIPAASLHAFGGAGDGDCHTRPG